jgi:hypothetical protein
MEISQASGVLTLFSSSNSSVLNLHNQVPRQVLKLKNVRIEFNSAATSLAQKIAFIDLEFLSNQQLIDPLIGRFYLPILLDNNAVTIYQPDLDIYMSRHIHNTVNLNVRNSDGTLVTNLVHVALQFQFDYGHTS